MKERICSPFIRCIESSSHCPSRPNPVTYQRSIVWFLVWSGRLNVKLPTLNTTEPSLSRTTSKNPDQNFQQYIGKCKIMKHKMTTGQSDEQGLPKRDLQHIILPTSGCCFEIWPQISLKLLISPNKNIIQFRHNASHMIHPPSYCELTRLPYRWDVFRNNHSIGRMLINNTNVWSPAQLRKQRWQSRLLLSMSPGNSRNPYKIFKMGFILFSKIWGMFSTERVEIWVFLGLVLYHGIHTLVSQTKCFHNYVCQRWLIHQSNIRVGSSAMML